MSQFSRYWDVVNSFNPYRTFYVSSLFGDDSNPGGSAAPWRTLQHAVDNVDRKDAICIKSKRSAGEVVDVNVPDILIYNGDNDEGGARGLQAFQAIHIRQPGVMLAGITVETITNLDTSADFSDATGNMLDNSGPYPVWNDNPVPYDANGLTLYRCVLGGIFKPPQVGLYWRGGGPIKLVESSMGFSDYGVVLRSVGQSIFGRNIFLGGSVGIYCEDEDLIKASAESGGASFEALIVGAVPNRFLDNTFLNSINEIWDNNLVIGNMAKRNLYTVALFSLTLEAWGTKYWDTEAWQNTVEFIYTEYGIAIESPEMIGYSLAQLSLAELYEVYSYLSEQGSPEFSSIMTSYWGALTPNEQRSGYLNSRRRGVEVKPDVADYLVEHIENPGTIDEYTWYGADDEYKAMMAARQSDFGMIAYPPVIPFNPFSEYRPTDDPIYPNDILDRGGYDMDTIGDGQFGYKIVPYPSDLNLCNVWGKVNDLGLTTENANRVEVVFEAVLPEAAGPDPSIITRPEVVAKPDHLTGEFTVALARGAKVRVVCIEAGLDETFTVPDQPTAKLTDLITI